jgi:hypothetical protein
MYDWKQEKKGNFKVLMCFCCFLVEKLLTLLPHCLLHTIAELKKSLYIPSIQTFGG